MKEIKRNSWRAWLLAARPKTLAGAATPVLIGAALAYADGQFQWLPALVCFLFAGLMQIAANFINDLVDCLKGTDREDRLGPERACAQGWISPGAMKLGIIFTIIPNAKYKYRPKGSPKRTMIVRFPLWASASRSR